MKVNVMKKTVKRKIGLKTKENIVISSLYAWLIISALAMIFTNEFQDCVKVTIASLLSIACLITVLKNLFRRIL
jgi:hypothetical protein|nr:MAG TPA: hypothetical protein [Caudoviricetes sp.]